MGAGTKQGWKRKLLPAPGTWLNLYISWKKVCKKTSGFPLASLGVFHVLRQPPRLFHWKPGRVARGDSFPLSPPPPTSPGSPAPHSLRRQRRAGAGASTAEHQRAGFDHEKIWILHKLKWWCFTMKHYLKMAFNHEKSEFNHLKCGFNHQKQDLAKNMRM